MKRQYWLEDEDVDYIIDLLNTEKESLREEVELAEGNFAPAQSAEAQNKKDLEQVDRLYKYLRSGQPGVINIG
jgi:hypothetical protein